MKNKIFSKDIIISITISGIFLALIIVTNFIFDLFKVWNWSIQVSLIIYAIGIYKIKNIFINIFFILITPLILFFIENGPWIINWIQVFFEYFLVYYVFSFLFISRKISNLFIKNKHYFIYDNFIFLISFTLLIFIKFFLHVFATMTWWNNNFIGSLTFNVPWLVTNLLTIPIASILIIPAFKLFRMLYDNQFNKW